MADGIGIVVLVDVAELVLVVVLAVVLPGVFVVDGALTVDVLVVVLSVVEGDVAGPAAVVGELDSIVADTLDAVASVVAVSEAQAEAIPTTAVTASANTGERFTKTTVPADRADTLAR